jgi:hypothetical protein
MPRRYSILAIASNERANRKRYAIADETLIGKKSPQKLR